MAAHLCQSSAVIFADMPLQPSLDRQGSTATSYASFVWLLDQVTPCMGTALS
jgi:hypothetical protein